MTTTETNTRTFEVVMTLTVEAANEEEARLKAIAFERIREEFDDFGIEGLEWLHVGLTPTTYDGIRTGEKQYPDTDIPTVRTVYDVTDLLTTTGGR